MSRFRAGVRFRTAAAAAVVVAVALVVAGGVMLVLLDRSLRAVTTSQAELAARAVAGELTSGDPADAALAQARVLAPRVQVLDAGGAVEAASPALAGAPPLSTLRPPPGVAETVAGTGLALDLDDDVVVVALGVAGPAGPRTVVVAESLALAGRSVDVARDVLLLGGPVLVLVAGGATYLAAGRSLRPVEAIRSRVAELGDRDLSARVPVPAVRDEVGRLAETMNAMLGRLQAGQAAQRQFVADASHELRSPLSTVVAGLDLVRGRDERDTVRIESMRADAQRMVRLVDDLLLLARADERGLTPRPGEVDLDELLYAEQVRLRAVAEVHLDVDVTAVRVAGDPAQLARVVRNLVDNAVRHTAGRVGLALRVEGGTAVLEVADDGPGVPEADRRRVFDRFVRLDATRARAAGGSGLGLAIVAEIVAAHGGSVQVGDAQGGGAVFTVRLPVGSPAASGA